MPFCEERHRKAAAPNMDLIVAWKASFAILTLSAENLLYKCSLLVFCQSNPFFPLVYCHQSNPFVFSSRREEVANLERVLRCFDLPQKIEDELFREQSWSVGMHQDLIQALAHRLYLTQTQFPIVAMPSSLYGFRPRSMLGMHFVY